MLSPQAGGDGTVIKLGEVVMILDLHRQGLSVSAIALQLGIDRKTARKYLARGLEVPVYGPRQPEEGAYALVLGIFLKRWVKQQTLMIHGDGSQRRDFVYVTDVADANIAAYESDVTGQTYNVGYGENTSIKELANLISDRQEHTPRRPGDAEVTLADVSRTKRDLKWNPKVPFAEGLRIMKELMTRD